MLPNVSGKNYTGVSLQPLLGNIGLKRILPNSFYEGQNYPDTKKKKKGTTGKLQINISY